MGCIIEFLMELIFEGVAYAYGSLMLLILPEKMRSKKAKNTLRTVIILFSLALFILIVVGLILMAEGIRPIGDYLTFVSLAIIAVQIISGIIVRIVNKNKNRK